MKTERLNFNSEGLIPAIVQEEGSKKVLMLAYMNEESLTKTIETGFTWFYSRSRKELWNKGQTSGNSQEVISIMYDCDMDSLLIIVRQKGPACHTGEKSCFYRAMLDKSSGEKSENLGDMLYRLYERIADRKQKPKADSYTNYLFDKGIDKILKKIGEESAETIIAAKNPGTAELIYETSDLIYHLTVLLVEKGLSYKEIAVELDKRFNQDKS